MLAQVDGFQIPRLDDLGSKLTSLIVGDEAVLYAGEDTRGYLVPQARNPTVGRHPGCLQRPSEAGNGRLHSVRSGDARTGEPADIRSIPAAQETGGPVAGDLPGLAVNRVAPGRCQRHRRGRLGHKGVSVGSAGVSRERSGPGPLQFRWSYSSSATEPLVIRDIAVRRQARLSWQG